MSLKRHTLSDRTAYVLAYQYAQMNDHEMCDRTVEVHMGILKQTSPLYIRARSWCTTELKLFWKAMYRNELILSTALLYRSINGDQNKKEATGSYRLGRKNVVDQEGSILVIIHRNRYRDMARMEQS